MCEIEKPYTVYKTDDFTNDYIWIAEHFSKLLETHKDKWIAVRNGVVIDYDTSIADLIPRLSDPQHTVVEFIDELKRELS